MSAFWFGVFAGLAVWEAAQTLIALAFLGRQTTIETSNVATTFGLMVVFMFAAWWVGVGL